MRMILEQGASAVYITIAAAIPRERSKYRWQIRFFPRTWPGSRCRRIVLEDTEKVTVPTRKRAGYGDPGVVDELEQARQTTSLLYRTTVIGTASLVRISVVHMSHNE